MCIRDSGKASIINGPVVAFEVTQQGSNGLYLLYLMAVYLAVFAITMLLQFTSFFMNSSYKLLMNENESSISNISNTNEVQTKNMESQ